MPWLGALTSAFLLQSSRSSRMLRGSTVSSMVTIRGVLPLDQPHPTRRCDKRLTPPPVCCPHHEMRWLARYRQYCNRKMRRLRKALKFVHWEQGKGKSKFQQKTITTENATGGPPPCPQAKLSAELTRQDSIFMQPRRPMLNPKASSGASLSSALPYPASQANTCVPPWCARFTLSAHHAEQGGESLVLRHGPAER
jgi:hypothetical protein